MAKFYGKIGYGETKQTSPGVWENAITERPYYGDLNRNIHRLEVSDNLNDNIDVNNEISIVADEFAYQNFRFMKYVEFAGAKWKITSVQVQRPRLILAIGGEYNE